MKHDEQVIAEVTFKICICDVPDSNLGGCYRLARLSLVALLSLSKQCLEIILNSEKCSSSTG